jgi:hypothetical protein
MNNREEDVTIENVDERVEQIIRGQYEPADAQEPLTHVARNLQRVYAEERRLEHAWERIARHAQSLESTTQFNAIEKSSTRQSFQGEQKTMQDTPSTRPGNFERIPDGPSHRERPPRRRRWRNVGFGLAAAIVLIAIFAWTITAVYHGHNGTQVASGGPTTTAGTPAIVTPTPATIQPTPAATPTVMPQPTPTPGQLQPTPTLASSISQLYLCQYFSMRYPAKWISTSSGPGGAYQQAVQFRPAATSPVIVNAGALYNNDLSAAQLLQQDSDVKMGTVEGTVTTTHNGLAWTVDIVNVPGSAQSQPEKLEVAYSKQIHPYRLELVVPADQFSSYSPIFDSILASFVPTK